MTTRTWQDGACLKLGSLYGQWCQWQTCPIPCNIPVIYLSYPNHVPVVMPRSYLDHILVISRWSCSGHIPVISRSYPGHIPVISRSYLDHIPVISQSFPGGHVPVISQPYPGHISIISRSYLGHVQAISHVRKTLMLTLNFNLYYIWVSPILWTAILSHAFVSKTSLKNCLLRSLISNKAKKSHKTTPFINL